jgi:hypothetical protein
VRITEIEHCREIRFEFVAVIFTGHFDNGNCLAILKATADLGGSARKNPLFQRESAVLSFPGFPAFTICRRMIAS